MTTDLMMLAWVSGFTLLLWIPYILAHIGNVGSKAALTYTAEDTPLPAWAERAKRAHRNAVENLAPFAAVVIAAQLLGATSEGTAAATVVYFWARVAHYLLYISGLPFGRTASFAVGWLATLYILLQILT